MITAVFVACGLYIVGAAALSWDRKGYAGLYTKSRRRR